jgi:hypothetical protein
MVRIDEWQPTALFPKLNKRSPFGQRLLLKLAREILRPIFKGVLMVVWV